MNYPPMHSQSAPWNEPEEVVEYLKCYVTGDLYQESELILDPNEGRWFHKSEVERYVQMCAEEFGWDEEEVQKALKEFNQ